MAEIILCLIGTILLCCLILLVIVLLPPNMEMVDRHICVLGNVRISWAWYDMWIGYFIDTSKKRHYVCVFTFLFSWSYGRPALWHSAKEPPPTWTLLELVIEDEENRYGWYDGYKFQNGAPILNAVLCWRKANPRKKP